MMKTLTILILGILIIGTLLILDNKERNEIDLGNIKISSTNLKSITDPLPQGQYAVCSLKETDKDNPCVLMVKGDLNNGLE